MTDTKKVKINRADKPGELRAISLLESFERMSKRPETRMDLQRLLDNLSPDGKTYARHLVMSGPSGNKTTCKDTGFTAEQLEAAMSEIEDKLDALRGRR